jgi:hypothetical protein
MLRNNNKSAWSAVACALLVLGLGLIAFATVGGAVDEIPETRNATIRKVPANYNVNALCTGVMVAAHAPYRSADLAAADWAATELRWDGPESPWLP